MCTQLLTYVCGKHGHKLELLDLASGMLEDIHCLLTWEDFSDTFFLCYSFDITDFQI